MILKFPLDSVSSIHLELAAAVLARLMSSNSTCNPEWAGLKSLDVIHHIRVMVIAFHFFFKLLSTNFGMSAATCERPSVQRPHGPCALQSTEMAKSPMASKIHYTGVRPSKKQQ